MEALEGTLGTQVVVGANRDLNSHNLDHVQQAKSWLGAVILKCPCQQ